MVLLEVPADVPADQVPLYIADASTLLDSDIAVRLAIGSPDEYGRLESMGDLIRRVTLALAGGAAAGDTSVAGQRARGR